MRVRINGPLLARATGVGREGELAEEEKKVHGRVGGCAVAILGGYSSILVVARNTEATAIEPQKKATSLSLNNRL